MGDRPWEASVARAVPSNMSLSPRAAVWDSHVHLLLGGLWAGDGTRLSHQRRASSPVRLPITQKGPSCLS